ncbi:winged helix DNA-binding domain-containing protein [Occultella glacieicola]|uniref:Winged helix DNA-binding domain-containing protein n=1 Tax=Occultella glacieicola TaxID=2518684 RepID=A0ABY2E7E0_9MICO|nr:crosslink repair DNA glycosylase YcaQ family protein [Occultella glacieicola]TDE97477.1 winged helix DNA-binding domain-containing protein [Occultella glacieicola]
MDAQRPRATVSRAGALRFRWRRQGLANTEPVAVAQAPALDLGVQDTGPMGSGWALWLRGVAPATAEPELALAWTLRGAPHAYRRADLPGVMQAVSPFSEADAAKRVFDASTPLRRAGIDVLDALDVVAGHMREIVSEPTVKGEMSKQLTARVDEPYLRYCRVCQATHLYEQPFRLSALYAGLELEPGTSPPVLRRIPGWRRRSHGPARAPRGPREAPEHLHVIRAYLRLLGPATQKEVAAYLDAPVRDVVAAWPADAVVVEVQGRATYLLESDLDALVEAEGSGADEDRVRLLAAFDPLLQAKDRDLLVPDEAGRKDLFRTIGRPGAVAAGEEVLGTWRPLTKGATMSIRFTPWLSVGPVLRRAIEDQGQELARWRGREFGGVVDE